jgi:hypothetical protein
MEDEMSQEKSLTRREFTVASALAMLSGVAITISSSACGGSSYSPSSPTPTPAPTPTPTPAPSGDKVGTISSNHGHSAVVTAARLTAAQAFSLDIQGSATHTHTVELSGADLTAIAANTRVSKESSTDSAHSHTVTFN